MTCSTTRPDDCGIARVAEIAMLRTEVERLRAEVATARREALEEAIATCEGVEAVGLSEGAAYCAALLRVLLAGKG